MRFELVLGLLSSFQIYHQSLSNSLAMLDFGYSNPQLALISAIFPVGKFFGTVFTIVLFRKNYSNRQCLDYAATLLIFGAAGMLLPSFTILCVSRLVVGFGVGIAFISAFVALTDFSNCVSHFENEDENVLWAFRAERRHQRRLGAFFGTAALFAAATVFANVSVFIRLKTHFSQICVFAFPAIFSALLNIDEGNASSNLRFQRRVKIALQTNVTSDTSTVYAVRDTVSTSGDKISSMEGDDGDTFTPGFFRSPLVFAMALMSINASIGVPIVLAYSSIVYREMGATSMSAQRLSVGYALIQLGVMLTLRRWAHDGSGDASRHSESGAFFARFATKRDVVVVGYGICLACMFLLLLTLGMRTLDANPVAKRSFGCFWFTMLAVASAPPCNAGIAIIATELFSDRGRLIEGMAISRAFFWVFSSVLCAVFLRLLDEWGVVCSLTPCFVASLIVYAFLIRWLPAAPLTRGTCCC